MSAKKILIIEDNEDYGLFYQDLLGKENELTILTSLAKLKAHLSTTSVQSYDLILADMMLEDGLFLDWIMNTKSTLMEQVPTIIVSSLEDIDTLRNSFEWGASDYLIKPFRRSEMLVKVEKARRNFAVTSFSNKDPGHDDILEKLTTIEKRIFQLFSTRVDQYLSREVVMTTIWKKVMVQPKTMDVHLSNIRKKMQSSSWSIEYYEHKGWKLSRTTKLK